MKGVGGLRTKKPKKKKTKAQLTRSVAHTAWLCIAIGFCLFLLCSCFSFDIGDRPSTYVQPNNNPTANLCGSIGSFCAYYSLYYVGPGVFLILISLITFFVAKLIYRPLNQLVLRTIGLVMVTVAASTTYYSLWPHSIFEFPKGSGGVIGIATLQVFQTHFASLGAFIFIAAIWIVGSILLADHFIFTLVRGLIFGTGKTIGIVGPPALSAAKQQSQTITEIWRKLSEKQKRKFSKTAA